MPSTVNAPTALSPIRRHRKVAGLAISTAALLLVSMMPTPAFAAVGPAPVDLGTSARYSVLAAAAATIPGSFLPGEVGAGTAITADANTGYGSALHTVNDAATRTALVDATRAYNLLAALPATGTLSGNDLTAQTITPGVYHRVAAYAMTTPATFDARGDPNAVFVLQGDGALNTTAGTTMKLVNGAQASNIYWVVRGAATLGASSTFSGTILSRAAITVGASSRVNGRALSIIAAVTLDADTFGPIAGGTPPATTLIISGGSPAVTRSTRPTISGATNAPVGTRITVTVAGQTLTTLVATGGLWSVVPATLPQGRATVVASVAYPVGTSKTATQALTVDSIAPTLTITGGAQVTSTLARPVISGTTNAPAGTVVAVTVAGQTLTGTVVAGGRWTVTPAALPRGVASVVATVADAAGNIAIARQALTLNPAAVVVARKVVSTVYFAAGSSVLTRAASTQIAALAQSIPSHATNVRVTVAGFVRKVENQTHPNLAAARAQVVTQALAPQLAGTYTVTSDGSGLSFDATAQCAVITIEYDSPAV